VTPTVLRLVARGWAAGLLAVGAADAQVSLLLTRVPAKTPAGAPIYVAGTFNNWNPAAPRYRLTEQGGGHYAITLPDPVRDRVEFKFTLGSWESVEQDSAGRDVPNRSLTVPATGAAAYTGTVAGWRDGTPRPPGKPTTTTSVSILNPDFPIPQLGRTRRVWLYLPPDYATSHKRYPVLYMHDGQNLFDASTSFAGEWGVDETLDSLQARAGGGAIVVGIDNGQQRRVDEYTPWPNPQHGGGEGDAYVDFLVKTLKPYIDRHYRTRPDRLHTGVAGSSMGGLISLYAALKYPDVFGRVGVFSPAFWFSPSIYAYARRARPRPGTRIYMVTGGQEGETPELYVRGHQEMVDTLSAAGFTVRAEVQAAVRSDGMHSEWFWRREFPMAYQWLFRDAAARPSAPQPASRVQPVAPAPAAPVPAWTRGAVCYEVFVRSFYDSDGDGIGDLNGLTRKLDYINDGNPASLTDLGASCIWLMPVARSPSYHGYDVSDYYRVEPAYGTNQDFKRLVTEAHRRGIRILVDMVLNHSSSELPAFQAALKDTTSPYRSWYRFAPTPRGKGPWGAEAWHRSPVRDEYYYGVFWSGMPDLDYRTPAVAQEAMEVATFWLREMGVDGFRLDAVPYLVEDGDCMTGCPGTHAFLRDYAAHIRRVKPDAYAVGEAWGNIATLLPYYPDQLTSYFAFELADSLLSVVRTGSAAGLLPGFLRLQDTLPAYRWSPILSNHDGTRTLTALGGDVHRTRVAAVLLLTLPGLPFIYYGEEIGMTGDKPDPRLRTPMQWAPGTGVGFTTGTPWEMPQPDSMTTSVALQEGDAGSLLNLYRRLIHLRKENEALATGRLVPLSTSSPHVAAYLRRAGEHVVLVVANLGATAASGVTIGSGESALPPGSYTPRNLLGRPNATKLQVDRDGRIRDYVPEPTIGPRESLVLDLIRR
jgi:glycosidase/predicted alpha/beta superfamily hydrolase